MSSLRKGTIRIGTLESLHGQVVVGDILSFRGRCCQTDPNVYLELPGNGLDLSIGKEWGHFHVHLQREAYQRLLLGSSDGETAQF